MNDASRDAFESWIRDFLHTPDLDRIGGHGSYLDNSIQRMWVAWNAALVRAARTAAAVTKPTTALKLHGVVLVWRDDNELRGVYDSMEAAWAGTPDCLKSCGELRFEWRNVSVSSDASTSKS